MNKNYFLGIDIGTSSIKVLLTDTDGQRVASHTHLYETLQPFPGYVEQEPESTWWIGAKKGIAACISESRISSNEIAGLCIAGMVPSLCPVDSNGKVVRPAILYRDNRAVEEATALSEKTGLNFTLQDIIPKLVWIRNHEPDNFKKIRCILNPHSYISFKLTGAFSIDHDIASIYGNVYNLKTHNWMPERMQAIGLDPSLLPPLFWPLDAVGEVTKEASIETGLSAGTPVFCGTGDSFTALLGSGTVNKNEAIIYLGTAATLLGLTSSLDDSRGECLFETGQGVFLGYCLTGGEITHWAKDKMLDGCQISYDKLEAAAAKEHPGCDGLVALPHLLGERTPIADPLAKGAFFGLSNTHTLGAIYRSLLEGVTFVLKDSFAYQQYSLKRLALMGGGANCRLWRQIIADIFEQPLIFQPQADNALGTAYMVGMALGTFDSFRIMQDSWLSNKEIIEPNPVNVEIYKEVFPFYRDLNAAMRKLYPQHYALTEKLSSLTD